MTRKPAWRRYLRFWRADIVGDVDDELRFHTEMRVEEYVARGMSEEDARRAVADRLGDVDAARTECIALGDVRQTHARNADFLDGLRSDVRYALRSLGRSPGWTAVALLTIALGVGATTTVFRVADTLLVRPLPYPDASRVFIARRDFKVDGRTIPVSLPYGVIRFWRNDARTIEAVAPFGTARSMPLGVAPDTLSVRGIAVDTNFLSFAGVRPLIGRNFTGEELALEGGPGAVLLTEPFWRRQFGASPDVVGSVVRIDGEPRTIIGVVPASLSIPDFRSEQPDVLVPLPITDKQRITAFVRLKPGVSPKTAQQELDAILTHSKVFDIRALPGAMPVHLTRPQDWLTIRQPLMMLTGAVALLLLVACTNIAHLLLARGASRQQELAVRHALGAGRSRLLRQLVTESVVLAVLGGGLAVFVGWAGLRLLDAARPESFVELTYVRADHGILTIASFLAIACGLAIGLLAAMRSAHRDLGASLRRGTSSAVGGGRLRAMLVVGEVALSTTLLVGALLLIHAVYDLEQMELGFDARGVYSLAFTLPAKASPAEFASFMTQARERAGSIPGVKGVTIASSAPGFRGGVMLSAYETPERESPVRPEDARGWTAIYQVQPDYFSVMGMPILVGRTFDEGSAARHEVVLSSAVARQVFPDGKALGGRLRNVVPKTRGVIEPWQTVIGVVPDVVTSRVQDPASPGLYLPLDMTKEKDFFRLPPLVVRMSGKDPIGRLKQFSSAMGGAPMEITNVREDIDRSLAEPMFTMRVLAAFAMLGVLLAAVGLFGVISYSVGQRTREIGVRMALGASEGTIARLVVGDGIRLALGGIGLGLLGAGAASRIIEGLLYRVPRLDPFSFGVGALLLLLVSVVACVVPMLRATGIDPAIAVRAEQ